MSRALGRGLGENCLGKGYIEDMLSVGRLQRHMLEVFESPLGYFGLCSHAKLAREHLLLKEQGVHICLCPQQKSCSHSAGRFLARDLS